MPPAMEILPDRASPNSAHRPSAGTGPTRGISKTVIASVAFYRRISSRCLKDAL